MKEWEKGVEARDQGMKEKWYQMTAVTPDWKKMTIPQLWEKAGLKDVDGLMILQHSGKILPVNIGGQQHFAQ